VQVFAVTSLLLARALINLRCGQPTQLSPVVQRRNKVAKRIWEQIQLANAKQDVRGPP
jgi:hypothetical protein